jgi:uncharacterized protein with PIN domain
MSEKLRRKGEGKTERPTCPKCQQDLKRSYTREYNPDKFVANGWECEGCKVKIWDKKE